jgi:hypothetical protein
MDSILLWLRLSQLLLLWLRRLFLLGLDKLRLQWLNRLLLLAWGTSGWQLPDGKTNSNSLMSGTADVNHLQF